MKYLLGFLGIILALLLWSYVNSPLVVTVNGSGEVAMTTESATLSVTAVGQGDTAADAITNIKTKLNVIRNIFKNVGVSEANVYESQITVVPSSSIVAGATGFSSSTSIGAKGIPSDKIESLIPNLYTNGASLVSQPVVGVEDQTRLEEKAYALAFADAQKQADEIAKTNHKLFKKAVAITQSAQADTAVSGKSDTGTQKAGVGKIVSSVSVSYKMW